VAIRPRDAQDPEARERWSEARIVAELRKLHESGVELTRQGLVDGGHSELAHAINHFGGLTRLRRIAGIPPRRRAKPKPAIGAELVLATIRRRARAQQSLASSKVPARLQYAATRHFGGWDAALVAAGIDPDSVHLVQRYTDEALFAMLRELAVNNPEMTLVELKRQTIGATLFDRFGSPEKAARAAGIVDWPIRRRNSK
jgi:hypothetical protein